MAHLSVQEFIETWEKSVSVTEVAQKTGLTKPTVQAKATQLRKLGIPLKKFKGTRNRIDVEAALKQLAKIRGTSVAALTKESKEAEKKRSQRDRR
jgi:biotin operon repressor